MVRHVCYLLLFFKVVCVIVFFFFFQAEDGIRDHCVTGVQTCALPICGVPEAYIQYGTALELWPSPNSAYSLQLRYAVKPPMLIASTDTPMLDERWHPGLLYKSVELLRSEERRVGKECRSRWWE